MKEFFMSNVSMCTLIVCLICLLSACGGYEDYTLGVPYRAQELDNFCVPASIQMWRLYDGLPYVSQTTIWNWLGSRPCNLLDIPAGIAQFTLTADAYADAITPFTEEEIAEMVARQVTSIDNGVPVIAVIGSARNHVGVLNGGKYSDNGTYYVWEFMYINDPDPYQYGAETQRLPASDWLDRFCPLTSSYCGQAISSSATYGWETHFKNVGDSVVVFGSDMGCNPVNCSPPAY